MAKVVTKDSSELNFETLAKKELAQLQRQYRLMETDRQAFLQGKGKYANRQGRMLEYLESEKSDLLLNIEIATSPAKLKKDKKHEKLIAIMMEGYFLCSEEIQNQLADIIEMEAQVDKTNEHVFAERLRAQALFGRSLTPGQMDKRMRVLENRKYHATSSFDSQVTKNAALRAEINLLLMERGRFHERYRQYKKRIAKIKNKMLGVVNNALSTYEGREEAVMKILILREKNDKESQNHVLEIKEYQRVFHHDQKLRAFMETKNRPREVIEHAEQRKARIIMEKEKNLEHILKQYKRSFAKLLKFAKTADIDVLLHQYLLQEQTNFANFRQLTDLNDEINSLQGENEELQAKIDEIAKKIKQERQLRKQSLNEHKELYYRLQEELKKAKTERDILEGHVAKIIHGVDVIFDKAGCSNAPVIQLLGNRQGIIPRNVCLCLRVIEHRIGELQMKKALLEVKKAINVEKIQPPTKQAMWTPGKKPPPQGGPFLPAVILTGQLGGEADEDDEEAERALSLRRMTYEEIKDHYKQKFRDRKPTAEASEQDATITHSLSGIAAVPKVWKLSKAEYDPQKLELTPAETTAPAPKETIKQNTRTMDEELGEQDARIEIGPNGVVESENEAPINPDPIQESQTQETNETGQEATTVTNGVEDTDGSVTAATPNDADILSNIEDEGVGQEEE